MNSKAVFDAQRSGYIFNIQNYSVHDGPGIRTIVFLKGCPLSCRWCSNPESQRPYPELAYNSNKCIGIVECGQCIIVCPNHACSAGRDNGILVDRSRCDECLRCTQVCPSKALHGLGKLWTVEEVLEAVEQETAFYDRSGGGMTISGGEGLAQPEFAAALLKEAKARGINTAIETCGYAPWNSFLAIIPWLDHVLFDIKSLNEDKHQKFTGVSNALILENFHRLMTEFPETDVLVRVPVVPGFNDTAEDIRNICELVKVYPHVRLELLPYHRMGQPKYEYLGREFACKDIKLDNSTMTVLKQTAASLLGTQFVEG